MKKFISKNANLRVVLKHGIPAEPLTGRQAVPGLYVKFENGIVNIDDEDTVKLMIGHSAFNQDFILVEEGQIDPYLIQRREKEPEHNLTEIEYGHVGKTATPKSPVKLTSEQERLLKEMAIKIANQIAPEIAKKMLRDALVEKASETKSDSGGEKGDPELSCNCGFIAKTSLGLSAHKRFCKKQPIK